MASLRVIGGSALGVDTHLFSMTMAVQNIQVWTIRFYGNSGENGKVQGEKIQKMLFFPNSWYNYRVLVGYFRESPRRSQNLVPPLAGKWWDELFLTTVTHFEHFLGPRCRTGAGPDLSPSLVPNGPLQGAPSTTQGSPREPPTEVMDALS